jgi:hypothetical protein
VRYLAATRSFFFIWERRDVDTPIPPVNNRTTNQTNNLITKIFSEILLKVALLVLIILMSMYVENYKLVANIERLILFGNL